MAKRFTSTEVWEEDWFLDMPNEYKLFWYYILSNCDHAGIFKVNLNRFNRMLEVRISAEKSLYFFNAGKDRIRVISASIWFIEDFFVFQYGHKFNVNNKLHKSIYEIHKKHNINTLIVRGLLEVEMTTKGGVEEGFDTLKDKDKDKDIKFNQTKNQNGKKTGFSGNFKTQAEELLAIKCNEGVSKTDNS